MLAKKAIINTLINKNLPISITKFARNLSGGGFHDERMFIGNREWVGYGSNGTPSYLDSPEYPLPAIRFQEVKGDFIALRNKEKGDWKNLTIEEKKKLYRLSFRQTLAEVSAPTGEWKSILGFTLMGVSLSLWLWMLFAKFVYGPKPHTFSEEHRAAVLRRMIDLKWEPLSGVAAKWDYEKDDWKK